MRSLHGQDLQKPLLQSEETPPPPPPPRTLLSDQSSDNHKEVSDELETVLSNTELPFCQRVRPAIWIELKLLWQLAAPAVFVYMVNYVMSMSAQIFSGHLGNLELAAASLGNSGIQSFSYGLMPMSMVLPGVVGFKLSGKLPNGVTATDLVLTVTQMLRKHGVVGKFVEFYGEGVGKISLADRASVLLVFTLYGKSGRSHALPRSFPCSSRVLRTLFANMSPEYGATMGFFPVDHVTLQYLKLTGRSDETVAMIEAYLRANNMFVGYSEPQQERVYSSYLQLDLAEVEPCISGPKRPHDRVPLKEMKADWHSCLDNKVGFKNASFAPI